MIQRKFIVVFILSSFFFCYLLPLFIYKKEREGKKRKERRNFTFELILNIIFIFERWFQFSKIFSYKPIPCEYREKQQMAT